MTTIYLPEPKEVKVGKPLMGWDVAHQQFTVTSTVIDARPSENGMIATTEAGHQYLVTAKRTH